MEEGFKNIISFINQFALLSDNDIEDFIPLLKKEDYQKGDFILKEGQHCNQVKFVISGIYRVYQLRNGKEITSYFNYNDRNPLIASTESILSNQKSKEYIECLGPGFVLSLNYKDLLEIYKSSLAFNTFGRKMAELNYLLSIERIESLQYKTASDRYKSFLKLYPNLINQIPHHYIASYLGITPESLSRIRKSTLK